MRQKTKTKWLSAGFVHAVNELHVFPTNLLPRDPFEVAANHGGEQQQESHSKEEARVLQFAPLTKWRKSAGRP